MSSALSRDALDLWAQCRWLGTRCCGGWTQQQQEDPSHGARGPEDLLQHQAADRAGEGVPLQQVPDAGQEGGGRRRPAAQRDAGESLVSEQTHEAEEIAERRRAALRPGPRGPALTRRLFGHLPRSGAAHHLATAPAPDALSRQMF